VFIVLADRFARKLRFWGVSSPIYQGFTAVDDSLLKTFSIDQKSREIREGCPLKILFLARLVEGKGMFEFLEGFRLLRGRGVNAEATVAGDGPLMGALEQYLEGVPDVRRHVHVPGYLRGLAKTQVLREHHIFCLPTSSEGLPTALLEAMAFGMGVVACPAGGIADFFKPGSMGIVLDTPNPGEICEAMATLLGDRNRLAEIADNNHRHAMRYFLASDAARFLRMRYLELGA
jgi:glycosyltransferase involved in cell wall biosynthesis